MPGPVIEWTPARFKALKTAYAKAAKAGEETFTLPFAPGPILTLYARYLIEYLENLFHE